MHYFHKEVDITNAIDVRALAIREGLLIWHQIKKDPRWFLYAFTSFYVIINFFRPAPEHPARAAFVLLVFLALFLVKPPPNRKKYLRWIDYMWGLASVACMGYIYLDWHDIAWRTGVPLTLDLIMGVMAIIVSVEATRRGMGWPLLGTVLAFLLYYFFGHYLPREYGGHAPFNLRRIISAVYMDTSLDGIFGSCAYVMFKYIFLIYMFGKGLEMTGATGFLIDLARAIVGTMRGGAAMTAVVGSSLVGTITGLATANVLITGVVTIPLMKKMGYPPGAAGGVEAAASSGGQIMPPVMGLATFLMMAFLSIPYLEIIKAAIFPAILYYVGVGTAVLFYSRGRGFGGVAPSEVPRLRDVLKRREGITFTGGFVVLVVLIVLRYSPTLAALGALATILVLSYFSPTKMTPSRITALFSETAHDFMRLGGVIGGIGLIIGTVLSTGLAFRLTELLLAFTGGALGPTLVLVMIACFILGMGLPPMVIYIIAVVLMAPALVQLGIPPLAAHMFCFYGAVFSEVTPPVAMSAYVACTIAKTSFGSVCINGMRFAIAAYIIPFAFVIDPSLCLLGDLSSLPLSLSTAFIGVILLSNAVASSSSTLLGVVRRVLFLFASILLILPILYLSGIGLGLALIGGFFMYQERRVARSQMRMDLSK